MVAATIIYPWAACQRSPHSPAPAGKRHEREALALGMGRGAVPPLVVAMSSCYDHAPHQSWVSLEIEESTDLAIVLYC